MPIHLQGPTAIETGSGKPAEPFKHLRARKSEMAPVRPSPCKPEVTLNAPHHGSNTRKHLARRPVLGTDKFRVTGALHTIPLRPKQNGL